ncbi:amino acid dehydrogenase [Paraburkholderia steynii]|uniref:Amino acid dehydrogenase n=1 Tax=Paraburkholderia steynii TaxID=1245441 RepID=A0A4R0XEJ2_9BURK|nr:amino acid dehydrogenase [Paraburkholderia steynii]
MDFDVIVLGAGIVGVSSAVQLQDRGRRVALVERRPPGEETSFGNAGLIESSSVVPYGFPRDFGTLLRYARNRSTDLYWDYRSLPHFASWLARFWWESSAERLMAAARDMLPLIQQSVAEHDRLIQRAHLGHLARDSGWMDAYRTPREFSRHALAANELAQTYGLRVAVLDSAALAVREPGLVDCFCGALHWQDPKSIVNPGALTKGYARLFEAGGGMVLTGDATTLEAQAGNWTVQTTSGRISAREVVVALGPWSDTVYASLGYRIPLRAKRGYHMHYSPTRPLLRMPYVDAEQGYVVAPMEGRLRLTTGVEIARRDARSTGIQLERAERAARPAFGLGQRLDSGPWLGLRPCTPDMRPVIGSAPRHPGLWFAFGHNHHGLTLGPVTGRLLAEMMTGMPTFADASPFRPDRFCS